MWQLFIKSSALWKEKAIRILEGFSTSASSRTYFLPWYTVFKEQSSKWKLGQAPSASETTIFLPLRNSLQKAFFFLPIHRPFSFLFVCLFNAAGKPLSKLRPKIPWKTFFLENFIMHLSCLVSQEQALKNKQRWLVPFFPPPPPCIFMPANLFICSYMSAAPCKDFWAGYFSPPSQKQRKKENAVSENAGCFPLYASIHSI